MMPEAEVSLRSIPVRHSVILAQAKICNIIEQVIRRWRSTTSRSDVVSSAPVLFGQRSSPDVIPGRRFACLGLLVAMKEALKDSARLWFGI